MTATHIQKLVFGLIILCLGLVQCSGANLFSEFGNKTTDEARLYSARQLINKTLYSEAITEFEAMSTKFRTQRTVIPLYASAYAGLCGLNFLDLLTGLEDLGTERLFPLLMKAFTGGTTARISACTQAETILSTIGLASARTANENFLMTFIALAKLGAVFSLYGDTNSDDVVDPTFNACNSGSLPEDDARQVGVSLVHTLSSLTAVSSASTVGSEALTDITTLLDSVAEIYDFCTDSPDGSGDCTNTTPASFDATQLRGIRTFIAEDAALGLGSCTGNFVTCLCP